MSCKSVYLQVIGLFYTDPKPRYNAGHLIEASIAHLQYYKNDLMVDPMKRYVSLIRSIFGPDEGQLKGYPGHPEIELALLRFYTATGHKESYDLAKYFLCERGNEKGQDGKHYYTYEEEKRGDSPWKRPEPFPENRAYWYSQAHLPIKKQPTIEGHSVRAMYLLTAVADLVALSSTKPTELDASEIDDWMSALRRLWANMVDKKMYITGGIGAIKQWEGFGIDYFLPQGTDEGGCYAETCASIAVMMFAERLLHLELDRQYADIMELSLYNNIMTAMSTDGKKFTYENQLASTEKDKSMRHDWFWCACCPPNVTRLYGSIGGYLWDHGISKDEAFVNVHMYTNAELSFQMRDGVTAKLRQESNWPWEGRVNFNLKVTDSKPAVTIRLRLPAWSGNRYTLDPAPQSDATRVENGYLVLDASYVLANPNFSLDIKGFEPRYVSPHPHTNQRTLALARGPIVYCAEDVDNDWETNHFKDVVLKMSSLVTEAKRTDEATGEQYVELRTNCWTRSAERPIDETRSPRELVLVPYYFRGNRGGRGHMRVGMVNGSPGLGNIFPEK